MALFSSNEASETKSGPPVNMVLKMKEQGFSNNQIVQYLQREGYKSHQIFDAINQADMKGGSALPPQEGMVEAPPEQDQMQQMPQQAVSEQPMQQEMPPEMPEQYPQGYYPYAQQGSSREEVEELVESVVEDKWNELMKSMNKVFEWKDLTEKRIDKIEHSINALKENFESLHQGILGKIGDYEQSISAVGTDVKALEKVFSKILPTLTENVSELSNITKDMKKKK